MRILQWIRDTFLGIEEPEYVFVYGSLRAKMGNHHFLIDADRIGTIYNVDGFKMYPIGDQFPKAGIAYPYCIAGDGSVVVECYQIDKYILDDLDGLEGYPKFYDRKKVIGKDSKGNTITAWFYFQANQIGTNLIPNGDWCEFLESLQIKPFEDTYTKESYGI